MEPLTTDELLTTTRAVRRRLDLERSVPIDVVVQCLQLALQAPTGGGRQAWRWVVVTDPNLRRGLAEIYRAASLEKFEAARRASNDLGVQRIYDGAIHLAQVLADVPVVVVACTLDTIEDVPREVVASVFGSIVPAVWSLQLALRSRGLGSVLTTSHLRRSEEVAALLGIPADVTQVALLPVAYTLGTDFRPARRRPVEEVVFRDSWAEPIR